MRKTVIVEGPLAFGMRRIAAANASEVGVQILSFPGLAARLAGGFLRPVEPQELDAAVRAALDQGGLAELNAIQDLPGAARATSRTLRRIWDADVPLQGMRDRGPRWADLALVESRVRGGLPSAALILRDLRDAAVQRVQVASSVLGSVELLNIPDVARLWRPLLVELAKQVEVRWINPRAAVSTWFVGKVDEPNTPTTNPALALERCANPKAEVIEALRWARELISSGKGSPGDIAICATSPSDWDSDLLVLATDSSLPIYCSHGIPALRSWEGQACAALADVLLHGLSQLRVRRLLSYVSPRDRKTLALPDNWWLGLERGAGLHTVEQWRRAIELAKGRRDDHEDVADALIPLLELLNRGVDSAAEAAVFLSSAGRELWTRALKSAPPRALEFSLQAMRIPDPTDPASAIAWGPARNLEAAPRPWIRMLGLTSRSWPRPAREDPLLPNYLLPGSTYLHSVRQEDERAFRVLRDTASKGVALTSSRRNSQGSLQAPSPLISPQTPIQDLRRSRTPPHAFSESDRLLARRADLESHPVAQSALICWKDWQSRDVTVHDGRIASNHPVVVGCMQAVQSATSLQRMIRDPIAFAWRYGLGWRAPAVESQPLALGAADFGELVHALLKGTVDELEPNPGLIRATPEAIRATLSGIRQRIGDAWPLERSTPPVLLWNDTLDLGVRMAFRALTLDKAFEEGTRTWSEVEFGSNTSGPRAHPWKMNQPVEIPNTNIRIRGTIDRVDLKVGGAYVRVTDYKTGAIPKQPERVLFRYGGELQRIVYAIAAKSLLHGPPKVVARLVYLGNDDPTPYVLKPAQVDDAIAVCVDFLNTAISAIRQGLTLPGPDAALPINELRIALPSALDSYLERKRTAIRKAMGEDFAQIWRID